MENQRRISNSHDSRTTTHEPPPWNGARRATSHVSRRLRRQGFTLIELVLVVILVAILSAIAVPRFVNLSRQADIAATRGAMGAMRGGMIMDYASRTLTAKGVAKFPNVVYHSWFMELDVPVNEIANTSRVANATGTTGGAVTGEPGQTQTTNVTAASLTAAGLAARATANAGVVEHCCTTGFACVAETTPTVGWVYESSGDYEGIIKPCGDNSAATGFTDDTADVW